MKRILSGLVLALALIGVNSSAAKAQVSAQNVLKRVSSVIEKLESQKAQVLFVQIDNIKKEQISTQSYELVAGKNYVVVAIGDDERIQDIDLVVVSDEGEVIGKDNDETNAAVVPVKPTGSGTFKMAVKGYKMSKPDGFYAIILCRLN